MKKLADISSFTKIATCNSSADDLRDQQISFYRQNAGIQDPRHFLGRIFGKKLTQPDEGKTNIGAVLLGQQQSMPYLKTKGTYHDFWKQLEQYRKAADCFCHMYANAELDGNVNDDMRDLRRQLVDFDSSIRNFADILKHNTMYRDQLQ